MLTFSRVLTWPTRIDSQMLIKAASPAAVRVIGNIILNCLPIFRPACCHGIEPLATADGIVIRATKSDESGRDGLAAFFMGFDIGRSKLSTVFFI
jgi:hypothetical protein